MSWINVIFTTKRNRKSAITFTIIGFLLAIISIDFARAIIGDGVCVSLFNISNITGLVLFLADCILAIIVLLIALYHWGEKIFWVYVTLTRNLL